MTIFRDKDLTRYRVDNFGFLPNPGINLNKYYIEPQLGGWQDEVAKAATNVVKTLERSAKATIDKVAKKACKEFPAGHELAKSIKSQPHMQQVWEASNFLASMIPQPYCIPFMGVFILTDVMETCSVTGALKTQLGSARIASKVAEFLIPIAGPLITIIGGVCGGVPAVAGPVTVGCLQASAAMFPVYDDLYRGNYVTAQGVQASLVATVKIVSVMVSLGLVSDQGAAFLNGDFFLTFSELYDDAEKSAKKGDKSTDFLAKVIKNPPKKVTKKKKPLRSKSYSPSFVDDKNVRMSTSGVHMYQDEIDDEYFNWIVGGAALAGLTYAAVRKLRKRHR